MEQANQVLSRRLKICRSVMREHGIGHLYPVTLAEKDDESTVDQVFAMIEVTQEERAMLMDLSKDEADE